MMRFWLAMLLLGAGLCCTQSALAARYQRLSGVELSAVQEAMTRLALEPVLSPEGRTVGDYYIVTNEVFGPADGFLQIFNMFHGTSRDVVFEIEEILTRGDAFDWKRLQDMERNLRNPLYRTLVVLIPVRRINGREDVVDILIVSRDVWSLRANSNFELSNSTLTYLNLELAENNLAGFNKRVAATSIYELDTLSLGLRYVDPRLAWSRYQLFAEHSFKLNHDTWDYEGMAGSVSVSYPLYSALAKWGTSVGVAYNSEIFRSFRGTSIRTWDNPDTEERETFPVVYDWFSVSASASATRSFGTDVKHDISFGYRFSTSEANLRDFAGTEQERDAFAAALLPRTELASGPTVSYDFYLWEFAQLYDFNTFALLEEFRVGPALSLSARWASRAFGSTARFATFGATVGYVVCPGNDAYIGISGSASARTQGDLVDEQLSASIRLASPRLGRVGRLHLSASATWQLDNRANTFFSLGGGNGFRGAPPGELFGENIVRANFEFRTTSFPLWLVRVGGVVFYDGGDAYDHDPYWNHAVGVGARLLVLPINRNVIRIDYGVPLNGRAPGFGGGTLTAGFEQAF